jgi:hypothetical protein
MGTTETPVWQDDRDNWSTTEIVGIHRRPLGHRPGKLA